MKILLAVDSSPASEDALLQVAARLWPVGSSFEILHVVEPSHLWTTSEIAQEAASRGETLVRQAVESFKSRGLNASGATLFGDPKTVIVKRAQAIQAELIVAGSHGASGLKRFLLGSVAVGLLREAPCSVEIVRGRRPIQKILLATDGSASSDAAARSIAARPWPAGSEVRVLSAVELMLPATYALFELPNIDTAFLESERAKAIARSEAAITRAREILGAAGFETSESVSVLLDPPKTIILNEAAAWEADLIVLGSRGHRGLDLLLLGSVSEAVATHASCSVEVIR